MRYIIYHSLVHRPGTQCVEQWIQSVRSIRKHNPRVEIHLCVFNNPPYAVFEEADKQKVEVHYLGKVYDFLCERNSHGPLLSLYPTIHKFLVLDSMPLKGATSVLYLDCDTFIHGDLFELFYRHQQGWCAREEILTKQSPFGYDPTYVNENVYAFQAMREGKRPVLNFNAGICLMNQQIWHTVEKLDKLYLDYVWRLMVGFIDAPCLNVDNAIKDQRIIERIRREATPEDYENRIVYPSRNQWLVDAIAMWFVLGSFPLDVIKFNREDVLQGDECTGNACKTLISHYWAMKEKEFFMRYPRL